MSPSEAAAVWAARLDRGGLTPSEETELAEWLADPLNDEALSRANDALHVFDADRLTDPHLKALRQAALEAAPAPAPAPRRYPLAIAASLATVGIGAALFLGRVDPVDTPAAQPTAVASIGAPGPASVAAAQPIEYASEIGKRRTVPLSDGSTITLNTNSRVAVSFTEGRRLIRLMRGQALFDVAHNPQKPFVVLAGDRQVTALGTVFDVRIDPSRMQVVLVSGNVVVDSARQQDGASSAKVGGPVLLQPGQEFIAEAGRGQRVVKIDVKRELLWRSGFVEFDDQSLGHAVAEINRYTSRPIELSPDGVADLRVSGVFRTDDPKHFADSVSELLALDVQPTKQGGIRLSRANKADSRPE